MELGWVFLSVLSAFGQALAWALKKKALEGQGVNNTLGFVSALVAGVVFVVWFGMVEGWAFPDTTERFWMATAVVVIANIVATWTAYRALDRAALSLLMPLVPLSTLAIVPIEYFARGSAINAIQFVGICVLVVGAILFASGVPTKKDVKAIGYFSVTVLCYAIASSFMGVSVDEARSGLFPAAVYHIGIAAGFIPFIFWAKETRAILELRQTGEWLKIFWYMIASGVVMAVVANGPATVALLSASASEVFALKRIMPFFALVLGVLMFHEKITKKHILSTTLLVLGAVLVVWFKGARGTAQSSLLAI